MKMSVGGLRGDESGQERRRPNAASSCRLLFFSARFVSLTH